MTDNTTPAGTVGSGEEEQIAHRRDKLAALRADGWNFPNGFRRSREADGAEHTAAVLRERYGDLDKPTLAERAIPVSAAGRLVNRRGPFLVIQDGTAQVQFYLDRKGDEDLKARVNDWDVGDIVAGTGTLQKSGKGDLYVHLEDGELLTKSLRPLPDQYYGVADQELRYRRRYLDLVMNADSRRVFELRARIIQAIRQFMLDRQFMEVETPMMQPIPGGAAAKPFVTHHNALDMDLYLRIAPELYLKRLVVGGFERVFEINRNFRNEGLSPKHNPEFTMLEFYWAYADYADLMDLTEAMLRTVVEQVHGGTTVEFEGTTLDFGQPIPRLSVAEALQQYAGLDDDLLADPVRQADMLRARGVQVGNDWGEGRLAFELFEELVEGKITQPVFITRHPTEVSPLSRRNDADPSVTDRFELFVLGREIANGFSELNDADDQAERFRAQAAAKDSGDEEAMHYDADYVTALEYGMPPTAGEGIGIDRLVMLLTGATTIRDVLLFPTLRPRDDG